MNLTINELERSLYIRGQLIERAALLEFEAAWDSALDIRSWERDDGDMATEFVCAAPHLSERSML